MGEVGGDLEDGVTMGNNNDTVPRLDVVRTVIVG
jgi:hypothetical protein